MRLCTILPESLGGLGKSRIEAVTAASAGDESQSACISLNFSGGQQRMLYAIYSIKTNADARQQPAPLKV